MAENMSENKPFAVVLFDKDNNYSSVPSSWISACEKFCYWPKKNLLKLIEDPLSTPSIAWNKFAISYVKYFGKVN